MSRGSIIKRGAKYTIVLDLGRGPDGKRIRRWHSGFDTKKDAERVRVELLSRLDQGSYVGPSKDSLAEFLMGKWLPSLKVEVGPGTWEEHPSKVQRHIIPAVGGVRLQQLSPPQLNAMYADLLAKGLSKRTVSHVHATIRRALADAVKWDLVARNPALRASPPRPGQPELTTWNELELRRFLEHVRNDRLYALWLLAASTGMRRGEVLGLRWIDVNLDKSRVAVCQALVAVGHQVHVSEPKTAKGRRSVAIDPATVQALKTWGYRQKLERVKWGAAYTHSGLVFTREDGQALHPREMTRWFSRHVKAAGLPVLRLHDLRHTHASLALKAGIHPKIVQERLGHANIAITLDTYSHIAPDMQQDAAAAVAALVLGDTP